MLLYGPAEYIASDIQLYRLWKNDSRDVGPGDAFVALKVRIQTEHNFVHKAVERGAKLLLVEFR